MRVESMIAKDCSQNFTVVLGALLFFANCSFFRKCINPWHRATNYSILSYTSCRKPDISVTQCKITRAIWSHFTYASVFSDNGMFNIELGNVAVTLIDM